MVKIWDTLKELGKETLAQIEIDTLQISRNCTRQCVHCSQDPSAKMEMVDLGDFARSLESLVDIRKETGNDMLANYLLTTTDSDPFLHPELAEIVRMLHGQTGKRFYLLTSGWYLGGENANNYQRNAEWIAANHDAIERVALTVSNFPTNPISIYQNLEILANAVKTLSKMPPDKFVLSPQYNEEADGESIYSERQTKILLKDVFRRAGCKKHDFSGRIFPRPIIGLGRADTILKVQRVEEYRIEAEDAPLDISTREEERPYSGYVNLLGDLLVIRAPRAVLNRRLTDYKPA